MSTPTQCTVGVVHAVAPVRKAEHQDQTDKLRLHCIHLENLGPSIISPNQPAFRFKGKIRTSLRCPGISFGL